MSSSLNPWASLEARSSSGNGSGNNSDNNPTTNPALNGRCVLQAKNTTEVRRLRTDHESEQALAFLKKALAGDTPHDKPSISLVVRRSLKLYRDYVAGFVDYPAQLDHERKIVRMNSLLPRRRRSRPDVS